MWNLKYDTSELVYETETDSRRREQTIVAKGLGAERGGIWSLGLADANCYLYVQMNMPEANATSQINYTSIR